jgi:hypothetical protein
VSQIILVISARPENRIDSGPRAVAPQNYTNCEVERLAEIPAPLGGLVDAIELLLFAQTGGATFRKRPG